MGRYVSKMKTRMKILNVQQIRDLDIFTIENEPIASIDLMEKAAVKFVNWFVEIFPKEENTIGIFCGVGNNGGDGFAIARLLFEKGYTLNIFYCEISKSPSEDCQVNQNRLQSYPKIPQFLIQKGAPFPKVDQNTIIIDAIFGSGLNRPVEGYWGDLIEYLNQQNCVRVAVDVPSGLFADQNSNGSIFQAAYTFSFELPKLAFLFPENHQFVGQWVAKSIGLNQHFINNADSSNYYIDDQLIKSIYKTRSKYDHKGTYGHALLVVGSKGKVGAGILAAKACLRSGAGLLTIHAPKCAYDIFQISVPEAMVSVDEGEDFVKGIQQPDIFGSIGVGCGIGTHPMTIQALREILLQTKVPHVLDADALNIISLEPELFKAIPENSILTPHPKEFERLFGKTPNDFSRNALQKEKAITLKCYIILKGAHTSIACPDGTCYFNSTGNPGMATGGSGDVLTGILTSLLGQGYTSFETSILGVYLHGLAGDLAVQSLHFEALLAGDIIEHLGKAFKIISSTNDFVAWL